MIPWPLFLVLARHLPRLEMAAALDVATGVTLGYLDARIGRKDSGRTKLEWALARARRYARGAEADD